MVSGGYRCTCATSPLMTFDGTVKSAMTSIYARSAAIVEVLQAPYSNKRHAQHILSRNCSATQSPTSEVEH